ncbi:MAG: indolepyruvate oxidoreductase subunit beta family protein [Pseudomonadota bacterium]|nr:indolepyruvate oxidoreductase subunit beta family protein [Pseudomonadota bacterium]
MSVNKQPLTVLLCALGGEGGGVLATWLSAVARQAGYPSQATSIPGVAQRTGATTYYLEFWPQLASELGGRKPVFGLTPLPGRLDLLVSSELLETVRQIGNGMSAPGRTTVIASTARALTTAERMAPGDGRWDDAQLAAVIQSQSQRHHILDMAALTREAGTVVSSVMLGCIAASGVLPFRRADYEAVVGESGASAKASLLGFALGHEAVERRREQVEGVRHLIQKQELSALYTQRNEADLTSNPQVQAFPEPLRERVALGLARVIDYQGADYGELYLKRLRALWQAEQAAGAAGGEATHETARWLALWMAFDDIVRVAQLKAMASRRERVRREAKADEGDLIKIYDHFKPGVPEFAGLLPTRWAERLTRWDAARTARGEAPWARPIKLGTHTVFGMLALRLLASMKGMRRRGQRFATEQALIERWLQGITRALAVSPALGLEVARCGRLIKGYGSTNERGKHNLLHVLDHLALTGTVADAGERAAAVAAAREAALRDEAGTQLDATLRAHGAPARPVREQPIRWMRQPRGASAPR